MLFVLVGATPNFGATPARAIQVWSLNGRATNVARINVAGDFALARPVGAVVEGTVLTTPVLIKRFPFGWQVLANIDAACQMAMLGVPKNAVGILATGMALPEERAECHSTGGFVSDRGAPADIVALRLLARAHAFIPDVVVVGDYAVVEWYGAGGGQTYFKRSATGWQRFTGGGGAETADGLIAEGMPRETACEMMRIISPALGCTASP